MCLTVTSEDLKISTGCNAAASSTMNDDKHFPALTMDGKDETYWASEPGIETV